MRKLISSLVGLLLVFVTLIIASYAWFVNRDTSTFDITGKTAAAYFGGGDGSEEYPYLIKNARHLYNLAWLQDLGYFDDKDTSTDGIQSYYFSLSNDIDMSNIGAIPPIGITSSDNSNPNHPFISVFNGNGHVISNVTISTDLSNGFTYKPNSTILSNKGISEDSDFGNAVGLFGVIGKSGETTQTANVTNFYLDNITVNSSIAATVGLVAGSVYGNLSTVGVCYSSLNLSSGVSTSSNYTLVGEYDIDSVNWEDKPGGSGNSQGWGSSIDIASIYNRLENMKKYSSNGYLYNITDFAQDYDYEFKGSNAYLPVVASETSTNGIYSETINDGNFGYFAGQSSGNSKIVLDDFTKSSFTTNTIYTYIGNGSLTEADKRFGSDGVLSSSRYSNVKSSVDKLLEQNTLYGLKFKQAISASSTMKIENASVYGSTVDLTVPYCSLVFKAKDDGYISLVGLTYGQDKSSYFNIYELSDASYKQITEIYKEKSTIKYIYETTETTSSSTQDTDNDSLEKYYYYSSTWNDSSLENRYYLFYFEIPIKKDTYYTLGGNDDKGLYFLYLDLGQNAGDEGTTSTYTSEISGVNFVYSTSTTTDGVTTIYTFPTTIIYFTIDSGTDEVVIYFRRKNDDSTDLMLYYIASSSTTRNITPSSTSPCLASDSTCTSKVSDDTS